MQFPRSEADIAALAQLVALGIEQAVDDFPSPPVPAPDLRAKMAAVQAARAAAVTAESAFKEQHAIKDEAIEDLTDSLKANLKYAEYAVRDQPEKLSDSPVEQARGRRRARGLPDPAETGWHSLGGLRDLHRHRGAVQQPTPRCRAVFPCVRREQGGHRTAERYRKPRAVATTARVFTSPVTEVV